MGNVHIQKGTVMADNNKDVVRVLKDITEELHQLNRNIRVVAKILEQKQFDDWIPPELGTAVQNSKGCVMLNKADFNGIYDVWCRANEGGDEE